MPRVVTINRPDVIDMIERVAARETGGNKTEAVALAMRRMLDPAERTGTPFGCGKGLVTFLDEFDLTEPTFSPEEAESWDASTGTELMHGRDRAAE